MLGVIDVYDDDVYMMLMLRCLCDICNDDVKWWTSWYCII